MRLTVVGCAGSFPSAVSPASCYLVEHDGVRIVLDLGNGSLGALQQYVDLSQDDALAAVLLSHCHIDHCADVASLFVMRHYSPAGRRAPLPLLGPTDTRARIAAVYGMPDPERLSVEFDVRPFDGRTVEMGPFVIETSPAAHPVEAYSLRVSAGGASITYSGDTGPTPALDQLARGTDIALFEASEVGTGHPPDLHMSGAEAGRAAAAADAGLLVLTHHAAWNDEAQVIAEASAQFDGPVEFARPGMTVSL